jgi:hypothetical protein
VEFGVLLLTLFFLQGEDTNLAPEATEAGFTFNTDNVGGGDAQQPGFQF